MQKEKLAAVGEFAANLTHEIRNPLATVRLALEYFEQSDDKRTKKRAALANSEITRLERMLNEVLSYAKPTHLSQEPVELGSFLTDFISANDSMPAPKQQHFSIVRNIDATVHADRDKLTQICLNLARNACDAAENGSELTWTIEAQDGMGLITLHNGGKTVPPERLERITEAFVSDKPNGTGLGLAIVQSLVNAHNGELTIHSHPDTGTLISVALPLQQG